MFESVKSGHSDSQSVKGRGSASALKSRAEINFEEFEQKPSDIEIVLTSEKMSLFQHVRVSKIWSAIRKSGLEPPASKERNKFFRSKAKVTSKIVLTSEKMILTCIFRVSKKSGHRFAFSQGKPPA